MAKEANNIENLKLTLGFYNEHYIYENYIKDIDIPIEEYYKYPKEEIIETVINKYDEEYSNDEEVTQDELIQTCNTIVLIYLFNILENFLAEYGTLKPIEITNEYIRCQVYERKAE